MERSDVIELIRKKQGEMSLRELGRAVGCSAAYLNDVFHGNRDPGPVILKWIGLEKKTTRVVTTQYRKAKQ